jgi:hypothetical protein
MTTVKYRNRFFSEYFDALNNNKAIEKAKQEADLNGYALVKSNYLSEQTMKVRFEL